MRWPATPSPLADELGLTGTHVFFNEGWVDVRRPPELPARGRRRREHPPRPRRDRVLVPHPASSTTSGRRCRSSRPAATRSPTLIETQRHRAHGARPATSTRSRRRCSGCSTTTRSPPSCRAAIERVVPAVPLVDGARAAARVLPDAEPCPRPRRSRDGGDGRQPPEPACGTKSAGGPTSARRCGSSAGASGARCERSSSSASARERGHAERQRRSRVGRRSPGCSTGRRRRTRPHRSRSASSSASLTLPVARLDVSKWNSSAYGSNTMRYPAWYELQAVVDVVVVERELERQPADALERVSRRVIRQAAVTAMQFVGVRALSMWPSKSRGEAVVRMAGVAVDRHDAHVLEPPVGEPQLGADRADGGLPGEHQQRLDPLGRDHLGVVVQEDEELAA